MPDSVEGTVQHKYCIIKTISLSFIKVLLCGSDNLIPELPNTAHSCGQQGPVTAWFGSARPDNVIPVPKTSTSWEQEYIVYRNGTASVMAKFCVLLEFSFVKH